METTLKIPKNPVYPPSMDYTLLRREGIKHIERMGSAIWTDYNSHDPGITMLEVLCYALTDLGHRTNLPPGDLFAAEPGRKPYFTAAEILPNEPVTARDIRKILIDIPGIHNAWVLARQEPDVLVQFNFPLALDPDIGKEEFDKFWKEVNQARKDAKQPEIPPVSIVIDGDHPMAIPRPDIIPDKLVESQFFNLLNCLETSSRFKQKCDYKTASDFNRGFVQYIQKTIKDKFLELTEPEQTTMLHLLLTTRIKLNSTPDEDEKPAEKSYTLYVPQGIYQISLLPESDCDPSEIIQEALAQLHAHRNLGEDFHPEFTLIERQPIALCANIEIAPDAHADEVLPLLYEAISEYLSPTLRFYTLQEMMDKNGVFHLSQTSLTQLAEAQLPPTAQQALAPLIDSSFAGRAALMNAIRLAVGPDVFVDYEALLFYHAEKRYDAHPVYQGPLLTHGFLDDAELDAAQLRQTIYKSDLYQMMLTVPGVVSIQNLVMGRCYYEEGETGRRGLIDDNWCLSCGCSCLPELDIDCSTFSFTKGYGYTKPDVQLARERYELLRMQHAAVDRQGSLDLPLPTGQFRPDLAEFTSVQEDFPLTYHIGREGLARSEPAWRHARAKQLKAYLLFFDQLLANYLAHLGEVRNLLAIDGHFGPAPNESHTEKAVGGLHQIPNVPGLLSLLITDETTKGDSAKILGQYEEALKKLVNGSPVEQELTRNRLLDHMLARFGEQFTDFALQYYPIERPAEATPYGDLSTWIEQKKTFLTKLPGLGAGRGRGFNYSAQPQADNLHVWNSANVAGLKRRICGLLGMPQSNLERMPGSGENDPLTQFQTDWTRHPISSEPAFVVEPFAVTVGGRKRYRFGLKRTAEDADNILESTALYAKRTTAGEAGQAFLDQATTKAKYDILELDTKQFVVGFWETAEGEDRKVVTPLMRSPLPFLYEFLADQALEEVQKLAEAQDQDDSFHLVEHILLRPHDEEYELLLPKNYPLLPMLSRLDPYSFQLTVVVPAWIKRFSDPRLMDQFEQTLRLETPAHLYLSISRYNRADMLRFETAYLDWLLVNSEPEPERYLLREKTNELIRVLNTADPQPIPKSL